MGEIRPFELNVAEDELVRLADRLDQTRWPEAETVDDWSQGTPLAALRELVAYWRIEYDWRRCEARLNSIGQFVTEIDGLDIHFLHRKSSRSDALPLVATSTPTHNLVITQEIQQDAKKLMRSMTAR